MGHNSAPIIGPLRTIEIGTNVVQIAPQNGGRSYFNVCADATAAYAFGGSPPPGGGIPLAANTPVEVSGDGAVPGDAIWVAALAGTANITWAEG